jgi:hypothetical protein
MSKMQNLQHALERSTGRTAKPTSSPGKPAKPVVVAAGVRRTRAKRQAGREGKFNLSSWQPKAFKSSLRLVQAHKGGDATIEELMAEALNDLFMKYKVPTVSRE